MVARDARLIPMLLCALAWSRAAAFQAELPRLTSEGPLAVRSVEPSATRLGRYAALELTVVLSATYTNPFDPEQIDLRGVFTDPGGGTIDTPGFFYQPCRLTGQDDDATVPLLAEDGAPIWKVRFPPTQVGEWKYCVTARDRSGLATSAEGRFSVTASDKPGFIRTRGRYFVFDAGTPFVPVGQNLQNDWPVYDHSRRLARAGCSAIRAWAFCHWTWLEWTLQPDLAWAGPGSFMRSYGGAGVYNQRIAWILDHHLAQWERDGLRVMVCLGNSGELDNPTDYGYWGGHPYNAANGGPLASSAEFWTNQDARRLYRQRLRYIVARYGHSPSIWAWELWNELGRETDETVAWHTEMAGYLKHIDVNRHLVTTSHWGTNAEEAARTWAIPAIDFTQTHNYAGPESIRQRTARALRVSPKPHVIGEGGGPDPGQDKAADPQGIDFHNSLWVAVASGAAGTTLPWWWRERIEPNDLFHHYTAISRLLPRLELTAHSWAPLAPGTVTVTGGGGGPRYSPALIVADGPDWGVRAPRNRFVVRPDGTLDSPQDLSPVLYGTGRPDWANPPTFELACPTDGRLMVSVSEASHAVVRIEVDGRTVLTDSRFDVPRQGFDADLSVALAAGQHRVTLYNDGADWARISRLLLTAYRDTRRYPDVEVYGLRSEGRAFLWIHHRLNEWSYHAAGVQPGPLAPAQVSLTGLTPGHYRSERWDTYTGTVSSGPGLDATKDGITIPVPALVTDTAYMLRRQAP